MLEIENSLISVKKKKKQTTKSGKNISVAETKISLCRPVLGWLFIGQHSSRRQDIACSYPVSASVPFVKNCPRRYILQASIKEATSNGCWQAWAAKGILVQCLGASKFGAATMKNNTKIPQNTKKRSTTRSSTSTSGCLSEENKNANSKPSRLCSLQRYLQ